MLKAVRAMRDADENWRTPMRPEAQAHATRIQQALDLLRRFL